MNVVIVNDHLYPDGGADMVALSSADALARLGAHVTFFAADRLRPHEQGARPYAVVSTGQMDLAHDPNRIRVAAQGLWNPVAAEGLRKLLRDFDPTTTIVHIHSWTKSLSSSVFRAANEAGFKLVCTLHDYFSVCPNGTLFNAQTREVCQLRPMSVACITSHCDTRARAHKLYRVARHVLQEHVGRLAASVDQFVTISGFSERVVAQHLPLDSRYVKVRNPIDVGEREELADPGASRAFIMVARMFAPKGWELFLEACERAGVEAIAVGEGSDREALQKRFRKARFTGQLPHAEVAALIRVSRALVLPSLWFETQGLVIDEAAALGVPSIVADTCGGAENIDPGESGLLFRQGDLDALTAAIRRVAGDDDFARRLGRAAAERFWRKPPIPSAHAAELLAVYEQVLAGQAAVPRIAIAAP